MIAALLMLITAQPVSEEVWPGELVKPAPEAIGPGPHTLVISDRQGMTRIDYPSGPKCLKARNAIRKQTAPPPNTANVIYGRSSVQAFCVPR